MFHAVKEIGQNLFKGASNNCKTSYCLRTRGISDLPKFFGGTSSSCLHVYIKGMVHLETGS